MKAQTSGKIVFVVHWRPSHPCQRQVTSELAGKWGRILDDIGKVVDC